MSESSGKLKPNFDEKTTKLLNLTVLQRNDPSIEEILITASHVTFYHLDINTSIWNRKNVEGPLFVVKRNTQPRFQVIVMNRHSADNLVEDLLGDFVFEVKLPYLLYRNAVQEVKGMWFYNPQECETVGKIFTRILNAYSNVPSRQIVPSAKCEFEELEALPNMAMIEGPQEPSKSTATSATVPEESGFLNFSEAKNVGNDAPSIAYSGLHSKIVPPIPIPAKAPSLSSVPTAKVLLLPSLVSSSTVPLHETPGPVNSGSSSQNLLKPSSFFAPPSSVSLMSPVALSVQHQPFQNLALNPQCPNDTPSFKLFLPPTPPSLTPTSPNRGAFISRDKIRSALLMLAQDDQFIDSFYRALWKVQNS